jgi:hypothetical protein
MMFNPIQPIKIASISVASLFIIAPAALAQTPSPPSFSPSQTRQIINGLTYPTSSQRFFEEGQHQVEREANDLSQEKFVPPETLLQIDENILRQGNVSPREKLPSWRDKTKMSVN